MTRALVTGGTGFVGRHLVAALRARGVETIAAGRSEDPAPPDVVFDLGDTAGVARVVRDARPDVVFHLAAQASVADAGRDPLAAYDANVLGTARVVEAIRALERPPLLLFASSGEVYGPRDPGELPARETLLPRPLGAYAASKLGAEAIVDAAGRAAGLRAVVTRAFNHIGPGQSPRFAVAAFARRIAAIAAGGEPVLAVGNLSPTRDFLDVRDVVAAYVALAAAMHAGEAPCGTYNVCGGVATPVSEIVRALVAIAGVTVELREDPELVRPIDLPENFGDPAKLRAATGWTPRLSLEDSLRDVYAEAVAGA